VFPFQPFIYRDLIKKKILELFCLGDFLNFASCLGAWGNNVC
jgi:hypothetical protein